MKPITIAAIAISVVAAVVCAASGKFIEGANFVVLALLNYSIGRNK